jgi:hypothetical protein
VIGSNNKEGKIIPLRTPFQPGTEVLKAEDSFVREIIKLEKEQEGAFVGKLDGKDIDIFLDLKKLLTKHVAVLAKSGSGKSYTVGVLAEEIMEKGIPLLIIDPHGEHSSLKYPNETEADKVIMPKFGVQPAAFIKQIQEYGDMNQNPNLKPLKLNSNLDIQELIALLPKLNTNQQALLYSAAKNLEKINFESLILELQMQDSPSKWNIIAVIDYLRKLEIFSSDYTSYNELIKSGKCSVINLKGINPEIQEVIVCKLMSDLFQERKKGNIPPFFAILEEAHNFAPERSFGETKASKILRTIASEGRKFGLGLCVVSQRPARVDKNILSQISTQIILKVTNPNDLRAICSSVEGITSDSEREIQNLPVGTAMITGLVDIPLFVDIRPRKTKHGGYAVEMFSDDEEDFLDEVKDFEKKDLMPLIKPRLSVKDMKLMSDKEIESIETFLMPAVLFTCKGEQEFNLLVELIKGEVVLDIDESKTLPLPELESLSPTQMDILKAAKAQFTPADMMTTLGIDFSRATAICQDLTEKGFLHYDGKYSLSNNIAIELPKYAFHKKIEHSKIDYTKMIEKKVAADDIKVRLSKLAEVKDVKECFIVYHKVSYKG